MKVSNMGGIFFPMQQTQMVFYLFFSLSCYYFSAWVVLKASSDLLFARLILIGSDGHWFGITMFHKVTSGQRKTCGKGPIFHFHGLHFSIVNLILFYNHNMVSSQDTSCVIAFSPDHFLMCILDAWLIISTSCISHARALDYIFT